MAFDLCMASGAKPKILVSACLLGTPCRFDGKSKTCVAAKQLARHFTVVPICPEAAAGLPVPRTPSERDMVAGGVRVLSSDGEDRTEAFARGVREALLVAQECGAKLAVLKTKSPACGVGKVYDGTFSGILVDGDGVATAALKEAGVSCITELELEKLSISELRKMAFPQG